MASKSQNLNPEILSVHFHTNVRNTLSTAILQKQKGNISHGEQKKVWQQQRQKEHCLEDPKGAKIKKAGFLMHMKDKSKIISKWD